MQRGIIVTTVVAVISLLGGCVADGGDGGILVLKNVRADEMCTTTGGATESHVSHGLLDLLIASDYRFIAQLQSRITAISGQESQRTIVTQDTKVDVTFPSSTLFTDAELADLKSQGLTHFKSLFSVPIAPNGGLSDGVFVIVPRSLVQKVSDKVNSLTSQVRIEALATFTVEGDMSGEHVESQPYAYPVTLGNNVTISVPMPATCPLAKEFGTVRTGYACNPFQDGVVDCCQVANGLRCPANQLTM